MPTTSNFGWTTPADTDLVKDGAAAIRTLGNGIDTSFLDLKGGTTGQVLSKASNTDLDFTWVAQDDSNAIQNALLTTTGDTIYASGASTPARLGIGTNGQVLTVSSGIPSWQTPTSGGITLISESVPSGASSVSFSSIASTYKQLLLTWQGLFHTASSTAFDIRFNNNSNSDYNSLYLRIINSSLFQGGGTNTSLTNVSNTCTFGNGVTSTTLTDTIRGSLLLDNYASSTKYKLWQTRFQYWNTSSSRYEAGIFDGMWQTTTAITSIDIFRVTGSGNLSANSTGGTIRLYGIS